MSEKIINFKDVLYRHGEETIEGGGFVKPDDTKQEEFNEHWEDDLHAARGCYGWPVIVGCIFAALAGWWGLF